MLCAFWLQNVLRATTPCTFNILTSKNAPELRCFAHFHFEMCFAPQCLALFQHMNFQKGVGREVLLAFLTSKRAARHSGAQFFISHLATWLRPPLYQTYFSTFRGHKTSEKHSVSQLFYLFARLIFVLLALSLSFDFFFSYSLSLSPVALTTVAASVHFAGS